MQGRVRMDRRPWRLTHLATGWRRVDRRRSAGQAFAAERHGVRRPASAPSAASPLTLWGVEVSCPPLEGCSQGQAGDLCPFERPGTGQGPAGPDGMGRSVVRQ
jgi:hypothetical protein